MTSLKQDTKAARESLWTLVRKWASDLLKPKPKDIDPVDSADQEQKPRRVLDRRLRP